jgi:protoporphyrinogen oxidase
MKTIILGAGITGLSAGIKTGATIYEATDSPGGICKTYKMNGYTFENGGGHWVFGDPSKVEKFVEVDTYNRKASVSMNTFFKYPIQSAISKSKCSKGSLKEWLLNKFGAEMCSMFFFPFNDKYTDGLYDTIIQDDGFKSPVSGKGYNDQFAYPKNNLSELVKKMSEGLDIRYNKKAESISMKRKEVRFKDGEVVKYDRLISTLPLSVLLEMVGVKCPDLIHTSTCVLNIGAKRGANCPTDHWVYVPFCKSGYYRVGFYSNVNSSFAPEGCVSIYVERASKDGVVDINHYPSEVIDELQSLKWIESVHVLDISWISHGYTWLTPHNNREYYLQLLKDNGITSTGRYGRWKFQGIAESIKDGENV